MCHFTDVFGNKVWKTSYPFFFHLMTLFQRIMMT